MDEPLAGCPARKLVPPGESSDGPDVERLPDPVDASGTRVVVRSFALARQVLRDEDGFHQAGFGADTVLQNASRIRPSILYLEGPDHRSQRRAAARVVGLTSSSLRGMTRRLDTFFEGDPLASRFSLKGVPQLVRAQTALWRFYWVDVKPAIRARRRRLQEDVINQVLERGFRDLDVLPECVTYGAAGMVTTRAGRRTPPAAGHAGDHPPRRARDRPGGAGRPRRPRPARGQRGPAGRR